MSIGFLSVSVIIASRHQNGVKHHSTSKESDEETSRCVQCPDSLTNFQFKNTVRKCRCNDNASHRCFLPRTLAENSLDQPFKKCYCETVAHVSSERDHESCALSGNTTITCANSNTAHLFCFQEHASKSLFRSLCCAAISLCCWCERLEPEWTQAYHLVCGKSASLSCHDCSDLCVPSQILAAQFTLVNLSSTSPLPPLIDRKSVIPA